MSTVFLMLVCLAGEAPNALDKGPASTARMKADLYLLASPEFEGRGINTPGIVKASEHIRDEFKKMGLKSATKDGTYFQHFDYGNDMKADETVTKLVIDGRTLTLKKDFQPLAFGGGKKFEGPVAFVGFGITAEGAENGQYDDYAGLDVAGKVVLIIRKTPKSQPNHPVFNENAEARYASLVSKLDNAIKHKAAAVLFVNDPKTASENNDKLEDVNYGGRPRSNILPFAHITQQVADAILAKSAVLNVAEAVGKIEKDLKPISTLIPVTAKGEFAFKKNSKDLVNVVAVLEGAGPLAKETIVVGAHYDHLGYGQFGSLASSKEKSRIHFGADDNASGTTAMMEIARRFASRKEPPQRRLVFMAFCAEESGLIGSDYYASKSPLFPIQDTVAMLNLDMVGRLRNGAIEVAGNKSAAEFEPILNELNVKAKLNLTLGPASIRQDSDHASFSKVGVPVLFFFTGMHKEYHKPTDTPNLINFEGMTQVVDFSEEIIDRLLPITRPKFIAPPRGLFGMFGGGGATKRGGGGVTLGIMPKYNSQAVGVELEDVRAEGPASKAGLKAGDIITEVGGKKVANIEEYMENMTTQRAGAKLKIVVKRGNESVTLEALPDAPSGARKGKKN